MYRPRVLEFSYECSILCHDIVAVVGFQAVPQVRSVVKSFPGSGIGSLLVCVLPGTWLVTVCISSHDVFFRVNFSSFCGVPKHGGCMFLHAYTHTQSHTHIISHTHSHTHT